MHQIFYVTVDPERALGVEDLLPSYHILHSQPSQMSNPISSNGIDIKAISLDDSKISTSHLLQKNELQKYINRTTHGIPDILVFKTDGSIEKTTKDLGYNLLNAPAGLAKQIENKVEFDQLLKTIKIFKKPESIIFEKFSDVTYENITSQIGDDFVVQFMLGHSGDSTFFIHDKIAFEELKNKYPLRKGKITKKVEGIPYTINACITKLGIVIGGISEQITGIEMLTSSLGGTVGNDFSQRHLNESLRRLLVEKTMAFGDELKKLGHRGIFGLDLVLNSDEQEFYIIECNPRQTLSCAYVSYLQRQQKIVPMMLWHILELINHDFSQEFQCIDIEAQEWINEGIQKFQNSNTLDYNLETNQPLKASQIFFRNIKDQHIKVVDQFPSGIYRIRGRLPDEALELEEGDSYSAVYRLREDGWSSLCLIKSGYTILEANQEGGFLIIAAPEGNIVPPFGEIGRIQVMDTAFSSTTSNELNGWVRDTIKVIYENMRLSNC